MARVSFSLSQVARAVWGYIGGAAGTTADRAVNTTFWNGTAVAAPDTAGYPKVTHKVGTGTGELSLTAGAVTVGTNADKTGYALTALSYSVQTSMQRATVTVPDTLTTGTATPSAVTLAKAKLANLGQTTADNLADARSRLVRIALTGVTTITATTNTNANGVQLTSYELSENP